MLTHKCDECDSSGYAEPGGTAHAARMATIQRAPDPDKAPDAPPAKAAKSSFSLDQL